MSKENKRKIRDELFKYKMGHKGIKQFTLDELNEVVLWKHRACLIWASRVKKTFK